MRPWIRGYGRLSLLPVPGSACGSSWAPEIPISYVEVDGNNLRYITSGTGPANLARPFQETLMQIGPNHIHFFISYGVAFLVFGLIGKWYVWPSIKGRTLKVALTPLLLYACLRVNGLMFLMSGIVSPELPSAFAVPTAYGDLTASILALLALANIRVESAFAVPMLWLFNIVGLCDLIYANISTFKDHVDPAQLGASYYLAVLNVPAMVVVHVLIFVYLLNLHPAERSRASELATGQRRDR